MCLRLVCNCISVRFLMALVQWCSGYVSFLYGGAYVASALQGDMGPGLGVVFF